MQIVVGDMVRVHCFEDGQKQETTGPVKSIRRKNPHRIEVLVNGKWYAARNDNHNGFEILKRQGFPAQ